MDKLKPYLSMVILLMAVCGVYSYKNSSSDVLFMMSAGVMGYLFKKMGIPAAPLILGILLGEMAEQNLRQSLVISQGNPLIFVQKPLAAVFLVLAVVSVILGAISGKGKGKVLRSDDVEQ
jgi:putative tricarboxylic transport membrane protein